MTEPLLWGLIALQIILGGVDTLFHHEASERLAWRASQKVELRLHGVRNLLYSVIFLALGWTTPTGAFAAALLVLLAAEVVITLWDFVEEDRSRRLPASERVLHAVLALNYGAILAFIAPILATNVGVATGLAPANYGVWSLLCAAAALATMAFGARDLGAANRATRLARAPAAALAYGLKARARVLITGATGFVGKRLLEALVASGHDVTALTRDAKKARDLPAPLRVVTALDQIANDARFDAIVHLAGEPVSDGLWTEKKKRRIIDSRAGLTRELIALVDRLEKKPGVFIAASAIGWYGVRGAEALTEADEGAPSFSHESCEAVEQAARGMEAFGVRTIRLRIGLVLGVEGGLLAKLLTPFEFGLGGPFGDGRQMMSWITRDDLVRLIVYGIRNETLAGAVNAVAPGAVSNADFTKALGRALHRPTIFRVPAAPLRFALGEFADELLLGGQNVAPAKAQAAGFVFGEMTIDDAFDALFGGPEKSRDLFNDGRDARERITAHA